MSGRITIGRACPRRSVRSLKRPLDACSSSCQSLSHDETRSPA
ncbi:hypothetical protein [Rhizobium phage RHEph26]|nr:hypothetical protein [Rhizobium phage RHEph26]